MLAFTGIARHFRERVWPKARPWPVPWTGIDVSFLIFLGLLFPSLTGELLSHAPFYSQLYGPEFPRSKDTNAPTLSESASIAGTAAAAIQQEHAAELQTVRGMWASLFAFPFQLGAIVLLRRATYPRWRTPRTHSFRVLGARLALAGWAWLLFTPIVFVVHLGAVFLSNSLGTSPEEHPLAKLSAARPPIDRFLFVLQACVIAPLVEEWLCRGLLLPWASRRAYRSVIVLVVAAFLVVSFTTIDNDVTRYGGLVLGCGFTLLAVPLLQPPSSRVSEVKRRRWAGIVSSAAFFAALHASVWPSPVPLFVFGLGLGWLATVTRGVLVPSIVHGLFNAVSVLLVLRGPS